MPERVSGFGLGCFEIFLLETISNKGQNRSRKKRDHENTDGERVTQRLQQTAIDIVDVHETEHENTNRDEDERECPIEFRFLKSSRFSVLTMRFSR